MNRIGGIVLCGGRSSRMGQPKAWLPFGKETMLQRVVRTLSDVVSPVVVVAAPGQDLPPLPDSVRVLRDEREGLGPLGGLAVGLSALQDEADAAYVSSTDVPLLKREFVQFMVDALAEFDLVIPREERFHHPLAAVYRTRLAEKVQQLLNEERLRPLFLVQECHSHEIAVEELRSVDPLLDSLRNANTPEEYAALLARTGIE